MSVSDSERTQYGTCSQFAALWLSSDTNWGDKLVPAFSQMARVMDPNRPGTDLDDVYAAPVVPALVAADFR